MNNQSNTEFLKKLTATFLVEAHEHVQALGARLLELEQASDRDAQLPLIETLFREAHSLKGAARAVNAGDIEHLCQMIESEFGDLKSGKSEISTEILDRLHRDVAALGQRVEENAERGTRNTEGEGTRSSERGSEAITPAATDDTPRSVFRDPTSPAPHSAFHIPHSFADTVRIATVKLDAIFVQAEELLGVKQVQAERASEFKALAELVTEQELNRNALMSQIRALRPLAETPAGGAVQGAAAPPGTAEPPARWLTLLEQDRGYAEAIGTGVAGLARTLADDRRRFDILVERLLEDVKKALMLPFSTLLAGFPKMVRDLAHDAGKEVKFNLRGADIEIDKRILEKIKEPLLHLVRNSVDHGIELPAERLRCGKPACGLLTMTMAQVGDKVELQVTDDGAGLDVAAVKIAAIQTGIVSAAEAAALRDQEAMLLVFRSGVTTKRQVTTVSGRGLGMAIVRDGVTALGGTVSLASTAGAGATVRIVLPLTLATLRGTLVRAANREFVVPTASVAQAVRMPWASIKTVENRDSICLDGVTLALVRLAEVLSLNPSPALSDKAVPLTVLVLEHGQIRIAFAVDRIMGELEVVAKPLGRLLVRVRNLAGATMIGAGRIVPILNVPDLMRNAVDYVQAAGLGIGLGGEAETARNKRLLVVDDSITIRTLLQNLLESAGFDVRTAPDGAAAFNLLHSESFDLVVTDVEMPRMDGFELTRKIRGETALAELPVVLVTAREAPEDRERGLDAGANAYLVKSSFDQSHLLEVIERLI